MTSKWFVYVALVIMLCMPSLAMAQDEWVFAEDSENKKYSASTKIQDANANGFSVEFIKENAAWRVVIVEDGEERKIKRAMLSFPNPDEMLMNIALSCGSFQDKKYNQRRECDTIDTAGFVMHLSDKDMGYISRVGAVSLKGNYEYSGKDPVNVMVVVSKISDFIKSK